MRIMLILAVIQQYEKSPNLSVEAYVGVTALPG